MKNFDDQRNVMDNIMMEYMDTEVPPDIQAIARRQLNAFKERMESCPVESISRWHIALASQWTKYFAIAAPAAAMALIAIIIWSALGGDNMSKAYANVVRQIREAHTLTFNLIEQGRGKSERHWKMLYKEPGLMRQEMAEGNASVCDIHSQKAILIDPVQKHFFKANLQNLLGDLAQINQVEQIRSLPEKATEILSRREMDGRTVIGFRVAGGGLSKTIWIETQTGGLYRIEAEMASSPDTRFLMTDFQFNINMPDSLFSMTPPGYTQPGDKVRAIQNQLSGEADFIDYLRWWTAHVKGGLFPPDLEPNEQDKNMELPFKPGNRTDVTFAKQTVLLTRGMLFMLRMTPENDWHYAGQGVAFGTMDKPIAWWRPARAANYRLIFADLTVREVTPDKLPR